MPEPESEPATAVTPAEPDPVAADTGATAVTEPAPSVPEPAPPPPPPGPPAAPAPPAAASFDRPSAPPPPPPLGPASTQPTGFDTVSSGQEEGLLVQRPEIAVGAAFAGGLVLALLLKRLAR
jgi:hypothetical protein